MHLCSLTDELGYTHIRQVEHYFKPYGGYSPNPLIFLTAAAMRTKNTRLITGAVLPAFNKPLKMAGEIGMLDGISNGRLEVGFARAFLPHEFAAFGVSLDESRRRFTEGLSQITMLLKDENVSSKGEFNSFQNITSLPRPTQKPHPPFWIAATNTPETFAFAGTNGCKVMAIPLEPNKMREPDRHLPRRLEKGRPSRQRPCHEHVLHVLRADPRGGDGGGAWALQRASQGPRRRRARNGSPAPAPRTIRATTS